MKKRKRRMRVYRDSLRNSLANCLIIIQIIPLFSAIDLVQSSSLAKLVNPSSIKLAQNHNLINHHEIGSIENRNRGWNSSLRVLVASSSSGDFQDAISADVTNDKNNNNTNQSNSNKISPFDGPIDDLNRRLDDDLLAIESDRILYIGKKQDPIGSSLNNEPPYVSNLTSFFNYLHQNNTNYERSQQNKSILYMSPSLFPIAGSNRPILLRYPAARQELKTSYQPTGNLNRSSSANNATTDQWLLSRPVYQRQLPLLLLVPRAGRPVISSSTIAPLNWPNLSPRFLGSNDQIEDSNGPPVKNETNQDFQNVTNQSRHDATRLTKLSPYENHFHQPNRSNLSTQKTNLTSAPDSEGSSIFNNSDSPILTAEDEFEKSIQKNSRAQLQFSNKTDLSWSQLLRQAIESNVMESLMVTNKSMVSLLCDSNHMLVKLKFEQPFHGFVATRLDRRNSCHLTGNGSQFYQIRVPLHDCGTRQESSRLFINSLQIKYHPSFDFTEDEMKTIVCSYPVRPLAPPPPANIKIKPERIIEKPIESAKLVYYEPIILISGLIMLALTLLAFTTGAYAVTRRYQRSTRYSDNPPSSASSSLSRSLYHYRYPPAQTANGKTMIAPPLIGLSKGKTTVWRYAARSPVSHIAQIDQSQMVNDAPEKRNLMTSKVSINPTGDNKSDSIMNRIDRQSVTTIDVPHVEAPSSEFDLSVPGMGRLATDIKTLRSIVPVSQSKSDISLDVAHSQRDWRKNPKEKLDIMDEDSRDMKERGTQKTEVDKAAPTGGPDTLNARSMNSSEYMRLVEMQKIVDQQTDDRILNREDKNKLIKLLKDDELFRSLIVESKNADIFKRKLRNNPVYSDQMKEESWKFLENFVTLNNPPGPDKKLGPKSDLAPAQMDSGVARGKRGSQRDKSSKVMKPPRLSKGTTLGTAPKQRRDKPTSGRNRARDVADPTTKRSMGSVRDVEMNLHASEDSLESIESKFHFVLYERHRFSK